MESQVELVRDVIARIGKKLKDDKQLKGTIGDLVRLIQLEKEMKDEEPPHEIKVTWVEKTEQSSKGK